MVKRAAIFANGEISTWPLQLTLDPKTDLIIAADGGARLCRQWNIQPHVVIGDLDSIEPEQLAQLETDKVEILRHPVQKDETDLELALRLAHRRGAKETIILGALGRRWDMTLANVMLLAAPFLSNTTVRLLDGSETLFLMRDSSMVKLHGRAGDGLSIIPLTASNGVTIKGLYYPLENANLALGATLGISNLFTGPTVHIAIKTGLLLINHTRK